MFNFKDVETKIAFIISIQRGIGILNVKCTDIAKELNIHQITYFTRRKRKTIPLSEICEFCKQNHISINWILYDQSAIDLKESYKKFVTCKGKQ